MKPTNTKPAHLLIGSLAVVTLSLVLLSWDVNKQAGDYKNAITDTVPKTKTEKKVRDLDDVMDELNKLDLKEQMERARVEIQEALKNLDTDKIRMQVQDALKEIDAVKIEKEIKESLAKVDWDKIKMEMDEIKKVNFAEIEKEMAKVREEMKELGPKLEKELEKVREEMKELGPKLEKELAQAKVEIEKAKTEVREYQGFVDGLEKEGLINKKENYTIRHKDGELTVNGRKVSADVYNKFKAFLDKHKTISIEKSENSFSVDKD